MTIDLSSGVSQAALLATIAAIIVVGGGSAFAYFAQGSLGKGLGITHLFLGLVLLIVAVSLFGGGGSIRAIALFWSGIVVAYSCASEAVVLANKILPAGPDVGSLGGTLVAVGLLVASSILLGRAAP
ncbi:MAG TPA: hypothetical protein VEU07_11030 [Candidatus Acidoferrum sp.]|nr:hypothetical protein [Candidatus Acidoferrum sp.]